MIVQLRDRRGFTLPEVLIAVFVMSLLLVGTLSMLVTALRSCDGDLAQVNTDTNAVTAMQFMVNDVREAKSVAILASGSQLCITFPITTAQGYYDRSQADTAHQVNYYLSDTTGIIGRTGTYLWRSRNDNLRRIRTDVDSLLFESDTARSIKITIKTKDSIYGGTKQTELTQRVVYLRNY
jgi:prepilin-type N-terminal cleavage/methylation domain-containing protein